MTTGRPKASYGDNGRQPLISNYEYTIVQTSDGTGNWLAYKDGDFIGIYPAEAFIITNSLSVTELAQELHVKEVAEIKSDQQFKADAGKLRPSLLFEGMPRALYLVVAVLSYGAQKYEAHSWKGVEMHRYRDAKLRHWLDELAGLGVFDAESGLMHEAHEICNALFLLEDKLQKLPPETFADTLKFNPPPTGHKQ